MAEITAAMVKDLREKTGVGMMDCKAALAATNGDMEAAVDWLRAKGLAKAAKKSTRVAAEGLVGIAVDGTTGAVVEVNSETDFVARNEKFQAMVAEISKLALKAGGDTEKLKTMHSSRLAACGRRVCGRDGRHDRREHDGAPHRRALGQGWRDRLLRAQPDRSRHGQDRRYRGARVDRQQGRTRRAFGRLLAMHVAATNPVALDLEQAFRLKRWPARSAILEEKNAGKPANVMEKIVASGLKTFAKENCLLEQAYVHDGTKTVTQAIGEAGNKAGAPSQAHGLSSACSSAKASRRRKTTSPPKSPRRRRADRQGRASQGSRVSRSGRK